MPDARWKLWLDEPSVRLWHDAMSSQSRATATERLRELVRYCEDNDTTPPALALKARESTDGRREVEDQLQRYVLRLLKEKKSPGYAYNFVKTVSSWLRHNDIALVRRIRVGRVGVPLNAGKERPPTPEQVEALRKGADIRGKVIIDILAFTGLRPESLGNADAQDGLILGDLPELQVEAGRVRFARVPSRLNIRASLTKNRLAHFTFLPSTVCSDVRAYLENRMANGEILSAASPLVVPACGFDRKGRPEDKRGSPFLETQGITKVVRKVMRANGYGGRPYALRSYHETGLDAAQRDGKIIESDRRFMTGRMGDVVMKYTHFKDLHPTVVEALRQAYGRCTAYLISETEDPHDPAVQAENMFERNKRVWEELLTKLEQSASRDTVREVLRELLRL